MMVLLVSFLASESVSAIKKTIRPSPVLVERSWA
jgi:hypothetical protein